MGLDMLIIRNRLFQLVPFEWGAARMKRCMEDLLMMGLFGDEGTTFGAIM